jgi:hypothetical protein
MRPCDNGTRGSRLPALPPRCCNPFATVGHRLFPIVEGQYLDPEEVAHRLRAEFRYVDTSRNDGARAVEELMRRARSSNVPEEVINSLRRQTLKAIRIIVSDRMDFDDDRLEFTAMEGGPLYIPYRSAQNVAAAARLLAKMCRILEYRAEAC